MAIFNSFTFDDENSLDSGIYITGEAVFNAPKRAVEMVNVPGRNGAIAIDEGRFENIPVTYPAGCYADNMADFAEKVAKFRNILASRFTYKRLIDSYHPNEFRMGLYRSGLEVDAVRYNSAGEFKIEFDCKPQRFLLSGEVPTEYIVGMSPSDEQTKTGSIVAFEAEEDTIISDVKVDINPIQDLHGYDKPWVGGVGKNKLTDSVVGGTLNGITFTVNSDGTITASGTATAQAVRNFYNNVTPSSVGLANGTYIVNGCPSDGSNDKYGLRVVLTKGSNTTYSDYGNGATFTIDDSVTAIRVYLYIGNGQTVNITFKPMIRLASVSDATYEPYENICPISGWDSVKVTRTGKNLLPTRSDGYTSTGNGITATFNSDGSVTLNGTAIATAIFRLISNTVLDNRLYLPADSYVISANNFKTNCWVGIYKNSDGVGGWEARSDTGGAFTVAEGDYVFPAIRIGSGVVLDNVTIYPMIRLASETDATYEPYNGNTYTIALNGTRYGGTLDVTSGVLTVDRAYMTVGSVAWEKGGTGTYSRFYTRLVPSGIKIPSSQTVFANIISDRYATSPYFNDILTHNGEIAVNITGAINITDERYSDASSFINAMSDTQIVYELATPITVQLTPTEVKTLLGTNNIWADSGDITVKYGTDPYIIINPTDFPSKPLLEVTGVGSFWLGDTQITITGTSGQIIYIDCETGECYKEAGGIISSANGLVTLNRLDFPKLASGINNIQLGSGISTVKITPRWWRL